MDPESLESDSPESDDPLLAVSSEVPADSSESEEEAVEV